MSKINQENINPNQINQSKLNDDAIDQLHLTKIRQHFEKEISKNQHESIDLWLNYTEWSDQLYSSQQMTKKEITDLYQRSITACKVNKAYQNDQRLFKLFLNYILKYEANKANWFKWMKDHKYCVKLANFYIEWSKCLEKNDCIKSISILENALKLELDIEQKNIIYSYLESFKKRVNLRENELKETNNETDINFKDLEKDKLTQIKFCFNYLAVKPDKNNDEEFQFEEIRARHYYAVYEATLKCEEKYLNEIEELKKRLAEAEAKNSTNKAFNNKKRDSLANKTNSRQSWLGTTYNTTAFNNTNFTNVTNFNSDSVDMVLSDDEVDLKENKSLAPLQMQTSLQPPPQLSVTEQESMVTLANIKNSMMTTINEATTTFFNKTITARTTEARRMAENMFNQTENTDDNLGMDTTNFNDKTTNPDTLPSISIYKDNQTLSDPTSGNTTRKNKTLGNEIQFEQYNDENERVPKIKKSSQDGSLFVYDQKSIIENGEKRKPLNVIADSIPEMNSFSTDSPSQTTTNLTKFMEFEPAMASTRSIRPLLNKMNEFNNQNMSRLETIIDSSFELACKQEEIDENNRKNEEEKEKLLSAHLGSEIEANKKINEDTNENNLSGLLAQDFNTQCTKWTNCVTQKTQKQVKFCPKDLNNTEDIVTRKIPGNLTTNINASVISWDYNYLEMDNATKKQKIVNHSESKLNITECQTLANFSIPSLTIQNATIPLMSQQTISKPDEQLDDEDDNENNQEQENVEGSQKGLLSQKKLEKTFNDDYYKLFYNHSCFNTTSLDATRLMVDNFMDKNDEDDKDDEEQKNKEILQNNDNLEIDKKETTIIHDDKTMGITRSNTTISDITISGLDETSTNIHDSHAYSSNNSISITTSITGSVTRPQNLNETVMTAIREPFNIEVKNRLLDKGPLEILKKNPNYVSLKIDAPIIKEKSFVTLKDGSQYKILEEIGKGSFAKIFLIEKKDNSSRIALKVDKQATSWEFYITESLHDRLNRMLHEEKSMKVNVINSFIRMNQFMKYQNGCFSAMNYYSNGSLLDLINFHVINENKYPSFPYWFVLYLTLEMLYIIQYLHKANIIHADIKPDNLVVNLLPDSVSYFDPERTKCLVLIDFNRSIDLNLLGGKAEFDAKVDNKSLLIPEMKEERPWSYQVDFYGILCSIHCVVFKKYMKSYKDKGRNRITGSFPRGYDKLFENLFDTYLNVPSCDEFPDIETNFIETFKKLFLTELAATFTKSKQYLTDLNSHFKSNRK